MFLITFLIAIGLFKLFVARNFPLIGDEAYYWLWGQHLDLSYVDHPPMIAYVNFVLTSLFGQSELAIRLGAISIVSLVSWIIYLTGKELYDRRSGLLAAVIFSLLPTFFGGGMFLVPQTLLFLFWSWSFYLIVRIIKSGGGAYWYLLGISAGLGLLSDYVMALFFIGTFLLLILSKENRFWLSRKEPYFAALISLLIFSPVIIWNLRLGFTPFFYWGGKMGVGPRVFDNLLNFFGLQMLLYTPPIFFRALRNFKGFSIFSAVVFFPFLHISPVINIGGHWTSTAYLPAIINSGNARKWIIRTIIGFALFVNILGFSYYLFFYPTPPELRGKEFSINSELPKFLEESSPRTGRTFVLANDLGMIGLVSFHGKTKVYMAPGRLKQVDLWGKPDIQKGDHVLYFALNETSLYNKLKPLFRKIAIDPQKRLFNKDADLPDKTQIFICEGFKGGIIP
jgi:hypothetical protein